MERCKRLFSGLGDRFLLTQSQELRGVSTARWMAVAFVLYGLTAIAFLAINVPPFQAPDEHHHFMRAAQIADGTLVGTRSSEIAADGSAHVIAGGAVDPAIENAFAAFDSLRFDPESRARLADWAPDIQWSDKRVFERFPNTALYPPFFYLPSALGILIGRTAQLSVVQTLALSRILNGVIAVAVGATAIIIARGAAAWIFTILALPMSLSLIASASQDAMLLACSALAGALTVSALRQPGAWNGKFFALLTGMVGLVAMARPPYLALAMLPLGMTKVALRWRILAAVLVTICVATWSLIVLDNTWTDFFSKAWKSDPAAQLARLHDDPFFIAHVATATLYQNWRDYLYMFVGVLGWLDTRLPLAYYRAADVMLGVAAIAAMLGTTGNRLTPGSLLAVAAGLLLAISGMFAINYLIGTAPGGDIVVGIQGRYFLPLALAGAALLPALGNTPAARLHMPLTALVAAFPLISLAVVMHTIVLRYYLE